MKTTITQLGKHLFVLILALLSWQTNFAQFTPGAGGSLPTFTPFSTPAGKIGGLFVTKNGRENNVFYTGTKPIVEMSFPTPSTIGADSYTLQCSTNDGGTWINYKYGNADLTTTGDNFSLNLYENYKLRLLVNGGPKNGYTSNEAFVPLSSVDSWFSGWYLDESMFLTGVMTPWVGRGLLTSFTVKKLPDYSEITGGMTYQWYRVNPVTYEMTLIPDSTRLGYTTSMADVGYLLAIRATGDGVNVGGYAQIMSSNPTVVSNLATVSNITSNGLTLNLFKTVSSLTPSDLIVYDKSYTPVTISSVSQGSNAAIYNIIVALDTANSPYYLKGTSNFWRIATEFKTPMFTEFMEGVSFSYTLPTKTDMVKDNELSVYPIPAKDNVWFKTNDRIREITIFNAKGEKLIQSSINSNEGVINTSGLSNGMYILRLKSSNGVQNRKIQILK